ncbi:MAG: hypothetical protein PHI12_00065 [Dehalococcoidales bacterium]|nr:hypothetical protein [Dehalococcoidales bacterium]
MVLAPSVFNDEIINSTDLKNQLPKWLGAARCRPITIFYKGEPVTIINRKTLRDLTEKAFYTNLVVNFCQNYIQRTGVLTPLPWVAHLSDSEKREFFLELLKVYQEAFASDNWGILEEMLGDWEATAEIAKHPALSRKLLKKADKSKYVRLNA